MAPLPALTTPPRAKYSSVFALPLPASLLWGLLFLSPLRPQAWKCHPVLLLQPASPWVLADTSIGCTNHPPHPLPWALCPISVSGPNSWWSQYPRGLPFSPCPSSVMTSASASAVPWTPSPPGTPPNLPWYFSSTAGFSATTFSQLTPDRSTPEPQPVLSSNSSFKLSLTGSQALSLWETLAWPNTMALRWNVPAKLLTEDHIQT